MNFRVRHLHASLALALAGTVYALGNWTVNVRFQSPALNYLVLVALVFSVPALFMASAWVTRNRLANVVLALIGLASLLPAITIGAISTVEAIDIINNGKDASFDKVAEISQGSKNFACTFQTVAPPATSTLYCKRNLIFPSA